jgi:hypothetical protein
MESCPPADRMALDSVLTLAHADKNADARIKASMYLNFFISVPSGEIIGSPAGPLETFSSTTVA